MSVSEVNAQDTVTVSYTHTFERNQTYCTIDAQFSDWVTFLDSIETLQATGDYRFIEAKYNSTDGSSTKEHVYGGVDIDPFITDLVSLDTTLAGGGRFCKLPFWRWRSMVDYFRL